MQSFICGTSTSDRTIRQSRKLFTRAFGSNIIRGQILRFAP